jgi:hypothetical protein
MIASTVASNALVAALAVAVPASSGGEAGPRVQLIQADPALGPLRERLQQQWSIENRQRVIAPPVAVPLAADAQDPIVPSAREIDRVNRVQRLIEDMERRKGAEAGTVRVRPSVGDGIKLEFDVNKIRRNSNVGVAAPLSATIAMPADATIEALVAPAEVEYRVSSDHRSDEQVIAVRRSNEVLASAFRSGEEAVTVQVNSVNLTARQIAGPTRDLPVAVTVNNETRELQVGTSSRFGNVEVSIQTSSNRSDTKQHNEGPPYALRLQVRSAQ